tara:strand:+ start:53 stop:442 length:390 start_codon:yes stop_codon:yes gene_type:complete
MSTKKDVDTFFSVEFSQWQGRFELIADFFEVISLLVAVTITLLAASGKILKYQEDWIVGSELALNLALMIAFTFSATTNIVRFKKSWSRVEFALSIMYVIAAFLALAAALTEIGVLVDWKVPGDSDASD